MSRAVKSLVFLLPWASAFLTLSPSKVRPPLLLARTSRDDLVGDDDDDKWSLSKFQAAKKEGGIELDDLDDDEDDKWSLSNLKKAQGSSKFKAAKLSLPSMGICTSSWGDSAYSTKSLKGAYDALCDAGVIFFATSQAYGKQSRGEGASAEQLIGKFAASRKDDSRPFVATTYAPGLLSGGRTKVVKALEQGSLDRLGLAEVDLYQVSKRFLYPGGTKALLEGAARAKDRGLCSAVGVVGFSASDVEEAHAYLASRGVPLVSNTVELSLLNQEALNDGTVAACKKLGVKVLAAAPFAGGLCSGRYTATNPTGGKFMKNPRQTQKFRALELRKVYPLISALESVARSVSSRGETVTDPATGEEKKVKATAAQVALNWVVAKGAVPLPGVNSAADARDVAGAVGWKLRASDVAQLEKAVEASKTKVKREYVKLMNEK